MIGFWLTKRFMCPRWRRRPAAKPWCIPILAISTLALGQTNTDSLKPGRTIPVSGFEQQGGFVNFVKGTGRCVCSQPSNSEGKQPLINGDSIELEEGRAEVVLIPGYYLRLSDH